MNVFIGCGSEIVDDKFYKNSLSLVAKLAAIEDINLVFGAYHNGLMGSCYDIFKNHNNLVLDNLIIIITFCIGVLLGLYFSIKLISFLFRKYFYQTYNVILGLLLGSLFIMIKNCIFNLSSVILGVAISIISYIFMKKINHFF